MIILILICCWVIEEPITESIQSIAWIQNKVLELLLNSSIALGKPTSYIAFPDEECGLLEATVHLQEPVDKFKEESHRIRKKVRYKDIGGDSKLHGKVLTQ